MAIPKMPPPPSTSLKNSSPKNAIPTQLVLLERPVLHGPKGAKDGSVNPELIEGSNVEGAEMAQVNTLRA